MALASLGPLALPLLTSEAAASVTEVSTEIVVELLLIACAVAILTKWIRWPYTVALTIVGVLVGFTHILHPVLLSKEVVLLVFLPPLLFEGTLAMDLKTLRAQWAEVLVHALPVTFLTVAAVAFPVHWLLGYDLRYALLLGAILAPTDPVSVIALFKEAGVTKRLAVTVEGESCFNDGVGVVLYLLLVGILDGQSPAPADVAKLFGIEVIGGCALGAVLGYLAYRLLASLDDHLLEVMISIVLAFGAYVLSERLHVSGVMAVVLAGLITGNYGKVFAMSPTTRIALTHFWEVMAFLANSLVFLLMGVAMDSQRLLGALGPILFLYALLTAARFALVHGFCWILSRCGREVPVAWRHVISWSGLRGALCVALAIGLPTTFRIAGEGALLPTRDETITLVSGVVLLSMVVQGLTMKRLLSRLGLSRRAEHEHDLEVGVARKVAAAAGLRELDRLVSEELVPAPVLAELRPRLEREQDAARDQVAALVAAHADLEAARRDEVYTAILTAGRAAVDESFRRGVISESAVHTVVSEIDARLEGEGEEVSPPPADRAGAG